MPYFQFRGPGIGSAYVAGSIASLSGVHEVDAGIASGLNNASFQIGGAVGVELLSTVAVAHAHGSAHLETFTAGYGEAFAVAIVVAALGLLSAVLLLGKRSKPQRQRLVEVQPSAEIAIERAAA